MYVSQDGSDGNGGQSPATALRSASAAFHLLQGGRGGPPGHTILLFKAGGTYPISEPLSVRGTDVVIGRYGDGTAKPDLLLSKGPPDSHGKPPRGSISIDGKCDGVMIQHLAFTTPYTLPDESAKADKVGIDAIVVRGRNVSRAGVFVQRTSTWPSTPTAARPACSCRTARPPARPTSAPT